MQREKMVELQLKARDIHSPRVLAAMSRVPRHRFVPEAVRPFAYKDQAFPIGEDQTISQPYIVALMTQLAEPLSHHKALEVGTGSGYQAAVLAELVGRVYTIEIVPSLAESARATLAAEGYDNVFVRQGDGYQGWPEEAPFDVILVTAAAHEIPQPLLNQLADGGRLVMPVGQTSEIQQLTRVVRKGDQFNHKTITAVRFVPMTGEVQRKP